MGDFRHVRTQHSAHHREAQKSWPPKHPPEKRDDEKNSKPGKYRTRRNFLQTAAASMGAPWIAQSTLAQSTLFGATAPSNRIRVACIGVGNQGIAITKKFLANPGCQVVAVCDVNRASHGYKSPDQYLGREPAKQLVEATYAAKSKSGTYRGCDTTDDFRQILQRSDIDAVAIMVPDHWHAIMTIEAARGGKDIYCEKPLGLTIAEGRAMVEAVRKHDRILQTGSHERSNRQSRFACELVRAGHIGKLERIVTSVGYNNKEGPGPGWKPMPVPDGFDYDFWLGPAPEVPYHPDRCLYRFRFHYDYSGGQITNFGAHANDLAQWGNHSDDTGPVEFEYLHAKFLPAGSLFNTALETRFRAKYANGVELLCESHPRKMGVRFEGSEGWVQTGYDGFDTHPKSLQSLELPDEERLNFSDDHVGNFIDCVKSRQDPVAPVEVGHRSASLCNLGVIACRLGKAGKILQWDPVTERFTNDEEANAYLARENREPWANL